MFTVLLADDESSVLETLKSRISWQELGVGTVLTAGNGEEALVLAKQQPISLVVADIRMPAMDGLTLIRHIRQFSPDTHCIVLSAYNEFEYAREAISLGVENYLLKPLEMEELEQVCAANHHGDERTHFAAVLRFHAGNGEGAGMRGIVRGFVEVLLQEDGKAVRFKQLARGFGRVAGAESQRFHSQRRGGFAARGG